MLQQSISVAAVSAYLVSRLTGVSPKECRPAENRARTRLEDCWASKAVSYPRDHP